MSECKWIVETDGHRADIFDPESQTYVAECLEPADAERIVRAVRCYEAMKAVCEAAMWLTSPEELYQLAEAALAKTQEDVTK